jgi:NAD-dependent dihydropyrimidine dehydrogenase PreA subunit
MEATESGVRINGAACVGCQVCMEVCPTDVIRMAPTQKAFAAYPEDCQFCFLCVFDCPVRAISIRIKRLPTLPTWYEAEKR